MKMPPLEKIPEAFSAIADQRVQLNDGWARIISSDGQKNYLVEWSGDVYSANDKATYWQGYPGYPIIAVLLLQGRLPYDQADALKFKGINWHKLNKAHKNNYAAALAEILEGLKGEGVNVELLNKNLNLTYQALTELDLTVKRGRHKAGRP